MAVDRRSAAATAGVLGIAVVAAGLAYLALTSTSSGAPAATPSTTGTSAARHVAGSTPTATASRTVAATSRPRASGAAPANAVIEPPLSVVSTEIVWRASGGDCATSTPSTVQRTADGGRTWTETDGVDLQVVAVRATSGRSATVVGLGESCKRRVVVTTDGGATWAAPTSPAAIWSATRSGVLRPGGATDAACGGAGVIAAEGTGTRNGYVLCSDGTVRATSDAGSTYLTQSTLKGAAALAVAGDGVLYAAVIGDPTCAGVLVSASGDDGVSWNSVRCVAEATSGGAVALAASGQIAVLVRGDEVFRSVDSAVTWVPVAT